MEAVGERLARELAQDEEEFGFAVADLPSGMRAAVRELRPGLLAVKVRASDGTTEYAICSGDLRVVYPAAKTLAELRRRFVIG